MLIRRPGLAWHALQPAQADESGIQALLSQSPGLLPPTGPGELAVATNFRVGAAGTIDLVGIGIDGRLVLVECGRQVGSSQRAMGGSVLALAAGLWRLPYEGLDAAFAARAGVGVAEAVAVLAQAGGLPFEEPAFRDAVVANLAAGRFSVVFAVDVVSDEVRRLVTYLNSGPRSGLTAVALGLRYLAEADVEILIPTLYKGEALESPTIVAPPPNPTAPTRPVGTRRTVPPPPPPLGADEPAPAGGPIVAESPEDAPAADVLLDVPADVDRLDVPAVGAPDAVASASDDSTDGDSIDGGGGIDDQAGIDDEDDVVVVDPVEAEARLFEALAASCLPSAVAVLRTIYDLTSERGSALEWGVGNHPAVTAVFEIDGEPLGVWSVYTDLKPSFVVNFEWLAGHLPAERLERLASDLSRLPSVPERLSGLAEAGYKRRLALAVNAVLAQPDAAEVVVGAIVNLLEPAAADAAS